MNAQLAEYSWSIILELKVVVRRGSKLIADDVERELVFGNKICLCQRHARPRLIARYCDPDACQHMVHEYIVRVVFADQVSFQAHGHITVRYIGRMLSLGAPGQT